MGIDLGARSESTVADRFRLEKQIGTGGFGEVWLARDLARDASPVALKLLHAHHHRNRLVLQRFDREARVVSQLDHPAIARAVAYATTVESPYLALEYIDGATLERVMIERGRKGEHFSREELIHLFSQLCGAVAHAHGFGIIHRDLKPRNVMIAPAHRLGLIDEAGVHSDIKVLDFGIAKILEEEAHAATTVGRMIGTPYYLAPEQILSKGVDGRTDVFALGSILFELLTFHRAWLIDDRGRPRAMDPNAKTSKQDRMIAIELIARGPRPKPTGMRPEVPPELDEVVARATSVVPSERFQSVAELEAAFVAAAAFLGQVRPRLVSFAGPASSATDDLPEDLGQQKTRVEGAQSADDMLESFPALTTLTAVMPRDLDHGAATRAISLEKATTLLDPSNSDRTFALADAAQLSNNGSVTVIPVSTPNRARTIAGAMVLFFAGVLVTWMFLARAPTPQTTLAAEAPQAPDPAPSVAEARPSDAPPRVESSPDQVEAAEVPTPVHSQTKTVRSGTSTRGTKKTAEPPAQPANEEKIDAKSAGAANKNVLFKRLDDVLSRARERPDDAEIADELSETIIFLASKLVDPAEAPAIKRCATTAALMSDVERLSACATRLKSMASR